MVAVAERRELTDRQRSILAFIVTYWGENGVMPTVREIGTNAGIASPNGVVCHLTALANKGYVRLTEYADGSARSRGIVVPELLTTTKAAADEYLSGLGS